MTQAIVEEPWACEHLSGTLTRPQGDIERSPVALIIAGSGPTPRDGPFGLYREISASLARAGIPSVRYDKRGIGQSKLVVGGEAELTFEHFVADATLAAQSLAARDNVSYVYIIGHSEGALIATLVAQRMKLGGIALLAAAGRKLDVVLQQQLTDQPLPPEQETLRQQALKFLARLSAGKRIEKVPPEQNGLFRPSVQPFLLSLFAIDPVAELKKLKLPILLVRGRSDIQVSAEDLQMLSDASPDARVVSLPRINHIFQDAPEDLSDRQAQMASYQAGGAFSPEMIRAIVTFIKGTSV